MCARERERESSICFCITLGKVCRGKICKYFRMYGNWISLDIFLIIIFSKFILRVREYIYDTNILHLFITYNDSNIIKTNLL